MIQVTSPALEKIKEVISEQGEDASSLRVIAIPAPQGGVQYMMTMEEESQDDDTIVDLDGVQFLMDSDSIPFLEEATIDYIEDLTRVGFVINNPNFQVAGGCGSGSCGCGSKRVAAAAAVPKRARAADVAAAAAAAEATSSNRQT